MGCTSSKDPVHTASPADYDASGANTAPKATPDGTPALNLGLKRAKSTREIQELERDAGTLLAENYLMGLPISSGISLEVRRCTNIVNGKRRAIKVIRKDCLT